MRTGYVALVGAGPGDIGLLTLRGKELLETADVVVYDRLVSNEIRKLIPENARKIDVGKESSNHLVKQDRINEILLEEALAGNFVVRLKGGDPFVFGRGGEELELLQQHKVPFEVVPGITSAISVPTYAGIPVTHRDFVSSVHIITGHQKENEPLHINFGMLSQSGGTLVFLMGVAALKQIAQGLITAGMDKTMPAAVIQNGTRPNQRKLIATLETIYDRAMEEKMKSPAIIIVGEVCNLSGRYDWFTIKPLFGTNVIVTRPKESDGTLTKKLKNLGADVFDLPCTKIEAINDNSPLQKVVSELKQYTWITFTSKNGVQIFFEFLKANKLDIRILADAKLAAIGNQTAKELEKYGLYAEYVPEIFDGEHLAKGLSERTTEQDSILLLRAKYGNEDLIRLLEEKHRSYVDVPIYESILIKDNKEDIRKLLQDQKVVYATYTSASTVEGFIQCTQGIDISQVIGICIGEQTALTAKKYGITHTISQSASIDSMIDSLVDKVGKLNNVKLNIV